jgi:hypothetical protein
MIKNIALAGLTVALLASSSFAGGSGRQSTSSSSDSTTVVMTQEQKDTLLFIYQEEKVARDAYITLGELYPDQNTFANIQLSEQKHIDSAQELCEKYGVDISNVDETNVGEYVVPVLQELYDTLVAMGSTSELDGLKVGEYIEITDIDDLEHAEIGMPADVVNVFENLKAGSYNHLDAFRAAIDAYTK